MPDRCGVYIDGFNLYHGVDSLSQPHLKWLDPAALARRIVAQYKWNVERIVHCTALDRQLARTGQRDRHRAYVAALRLTGVEVQEGKYAATSRKCRANCGEIYQGEEEKQSDTNLALAPIADLLDRAVDHVVLITGDSDQAPTLDFIGKRFPDALKLVAFPPNRGRTKILTDKADFTRRISHQDISECLFDARVEGPSGGYVRRPTAYDPPL